MLRRILGSWYDVPSIRFIAEILFVILPLVFIIRTVGFGLYQVPTGSMEPTLLVGERFFADKLSYWFRAPKRGEIIAFNSPDLEVCPQQGYKYSTNPIINWFQRYVWGPSNWTKRVIGIPGDHIQGKVVDGKPVVYLNGKRLEEPYVNPYPLLGVWKDKPSFFKVYGQNYLIKTVDLKKPWDKQPFYNIDPNKIVKTSDGDMDLILPETPIKQDIFDVQLKDNEYWVMGDNRLGSGDCRMWGKLDGKMIHGRILFRLWSMDSDEGWWILDLIKHPIDFWKKIRWSRSFQSVK